MEGKEEIKTMIQNICEKIKNPNEIFSVLISIIDSNKPKSEKELRLSFKNFCKNNHFFFFFVILNPLLLILSTIKKKQF